MTLNRGLKVDYNIKKYQNVKEITNGTVIKKKKKSTILILIWKNTSS